MNRILKKSVFKWMLALSMVTSPVLAIADTISDVATQKQTAAMEMPCHEMKHDTNGAGDPGSKPASDLCPCCDQCQCSQIETCHQCPGWVNFTILPAHPFEFALAGIQAIVDPANEQITKFDSPPLLPPPLRSNNS